MRTIDKSGPTDQSAAVDAGFTDPSLFDGKLYRNGEKIDASTVTVNVILSAR